MLPDEWDPVDQASAESFPASDPPGYGSSHASTTMPKEPPAEEEPPRRGWWDRLRAAVRHRLER